MIIFDLDDTLIDTSGTITPIMLQRALHSMIEHGLVVKDIFQARFQLWVLDRKTSSSKETLKLFLAHMRADPKLLEIGMEEMSREFPSTIKVKPLKNAKKVLTWLSQKYTIALVTIGKPHFQKAKLEKSGIDSSLFSKIAIAGNSEKKLHYQRIMAELKKSPQETVVVGDRVEQDLVPAKELGCFTIQMRWGRGLHYKVFQNEVDYMISDLAEIKKIIHYLPTLNNKLYK